MTQPDAHAAFVRSTTNHTPSEAQVTQIERLRAAIQSAALEIIDGQPQSREQSLAKTALEEAVMWGVKGIILNG